MATSPWNKQRYELEVINDKFSECLKRSRQLSECGEPYRSDHAALTRQNDDLQGILDVQHSQLAKVQSELTKKESELAEELLELERSEETMKDLERRINDAKVQRAETINALNKAEEELSKKIADNKILKERNKMLERELQLEQEFLERQQLSLEQQLQQEQLHKNAAEESVETTTGELESTANDLQYLDISTDGGVPFDKTLINRPREGTMKTLFDNCHRELKHLEAVTKQKTWETFDKIQKNCDRKLGEIQGKTNLEFTKLQVTNGKVLDRINKLAPTIRELQRETVSQGIQISQLQNVLDEQKKDLDAGLTFELYYYKLLLEDLAEQRDDSLHQNITKPHEASFDSQCPSQLEEDSSVVQCTTSNQSQLPYHERPTRFRLHSKSSFVRNLGEVKALVDATEAASKRMLQTELSKTTDE